MKKQILISFLVVLFSLQLLFAQETSIPDPNFEQVLIDLGIDTDGEINGEVLTVDINTIPELNISNKNISNLSGIEDFENLEVLNCSSNALGFLDLRQNTALTSLDCSYNSLSSLNLSNNTSLTSVNCRSNTLTALNVNNGNNTALVTLNALDNVDLRCIQADSETVPSGANWQIHDNIASYSTNCHYNETEIVDPNFEKALIELDLDSTTDINDTDGYVPTTKIDNILMLDISGKNINDLSGIRDFRALRDLNCSNNALTAFDVKFNNYLLTINCSNNQITALDFSLNKNLTDLDCSDNNLSKLSIKNNNNTELETFNATSNLNLTCIEVDDPVIADQATGWQIDNTASYNEHCDLTTISDQKFEAYLETHDVDGNEVPIESGEGMGNGVDNDNLVSTTKIKNVRVLNISGQGIIDVSGIEHFTALEDLRCSKNSISNLILSSNLELSALDCSYNQLIDLDLTNNSALTDLNCSNNQLTNTFDLSSNDQLKYVSCASNQLIDIVLEQNDLLTILNCSGNQLTSLNLLNGYGDAANPLLKTLVCSKNQIISLDVKKNNLLSILDCSQNFIESLDVTNNTELKTLTATFNQLDILVISQNLKLEVLNISGNLVSNLDLETNTFITSLDCSNNQLTTLTIKNGNNSQLEIFNAVNNPDLYCIEVDDDSEIGMVWIKDDAAVYKDVCEPITYVPDDNFEQHLISKGYDSGDLDNFVPTINIEVLPTLDISGLGIELLTGIEDFEALDSLNCANNLLYNLNVTPLGDLSYLDCSNNNLVDLTLKNDTPTLTFLDATGNPLLSCIKVDDVDAANAETDWIIDTTATYSLDCTANKTFIPDDNFEQALIDLEYDGGSLDNYVITDSISTVKVLKINDKNISDLTGIAAFMDLEFLHVSSNFLIEDELTEEEIFVPSNKLSVLDISENTKLKELSCYGNYITELILSNNDSLQVLNCGNNQLKQLDVSQNLRLETLIVDSNYLTTINISTNDSLTLFNGNSNYFSNILNLESNFILDTLFVAGNKLTNIGVSQNIKLKNFDCSNNLITTIDLDTNEDLQDLDCSLNLLTDLNLTNNPGLEIIKCNSNKLSNFNITSNTTLRFISVEDNLLSDINVEAYVALDSLLVSFNQLETLNVQQNIQMRGLKTDGNLLTTLNIDNNEALLGLSCKENQLESLDTSNNILLNNLSCDGNQLQDFDPTSNPALLNLSISRNQIEEVNLENNIALISLICDNNSLLELNLFSNLALSNISCSTNNITELNLSLNPNLVSVNAISNALEALNIRNGNNDILKSFNTSNNPDLSCIEVEDTDNISDNWQKDETASYSENCHYNEIYLPDDNFEQVLIDDYNISGTLDDYVKTDEINTIINLDIYDKGILDLTGIQAFTDLEVLNCSSNSLDSLNVTNNTALITLKTSNNLLDKLFVSDTTAIENLDIASNQFSEIDLNTFSNIKDFNCDDNQLSDLDLGSNTVLTDFTCASNQLVTLKVNNGNNNILTNLNALNNPNLTCIEVDDPAAANQAAGWQIEDTASYSANCHYNETFVPDDAFEQALIDLGHDPVTDLDDYVPTGAIKEILNLLISNKGISDLTGLEDFEDLVSLNCSANELTNVDVSNNLLLENLNCSSNQITQFNFASHPLLIEVNIADNLFPAIDISNNLELKKLTCSSNLLTSLDITQNPNLELLFCSSNQLVSVDANNGFNNILIDFDSRDNPNLRCILVDDIATAESYANWFKDASAAYKLECDDDDNDGVIDEEDLCPNTPFGEPVDLFGCPYLILPTDNFTILITGETCISSNNGKINISTAETYNYTATIIGEDYSNTYDFTNSVEIRNLLAGNYQLCLTVEAVPNYMSCYEIQITEPETFTVSSRLSQSDNNMFFDLSGGTTYTIDFNGLIFNTTAEEITLSLSNGINTIKIYTDLECQGIHNESIFLSNDVLVYPNPFNNNFNIHIGNNDTETVDVVIYSSLGQVVMSSTLIAKNGSIALDGSGLPSGMYFASIKTKTSLTKLKIVKK